VIFNSLGSGKSASLLNTVIIGAVNVVSTFVSILSGEAAACIVEGLGSSTLLVLRLLVAHTRLCCCPARALAAHAP
jgi:hypothetical protein